MDKCDKHDETMDRLFEKININLNTLTQINTKMDDIKEFKDLLHQIIFGNGKEGLKDTANKLENQVRLQWSLLITVIFGVITGTSIGVIISFFK